MVGDGEINGAALDAAYEEQLLREAQQPELQEPDPADSVLNLGARAAVEPQLARAANSEEDSEEEEESGAKVEGEDLFESVILAVRWIALAVPLAWVERQPIITKHSGHGSNAVPLCHADQHTTWPISSLQHAFLWHACNGCIPSLDCSTTYKLLRQPFNGPTGCFSHSELVQWIASATHAGCSTSTMYCTFNIIIVNIWRLWRWFELFNILSIYHGRGGDIELQTLIYGASIYSAF